MYAAELYLAIGLIAVGFLLLAVEIVFPHGVCLAVSILALAAAVVLAFLRDTQTGWVMLGGVIIAFATMVGLLRYCWTQTALGRQMVLQAPEGNTTAADTPANRELGRLVGRLGKAEGSLRPSGIVIFDGRRIDCLTEGLLVESGQIVRCVAVQAGKVIVRPVKVMPDLDAGGLDLDKPLFE